MAFTEADMKFWHDQLLYADRAWYEAGLIDTADKASMRQDGITALYRYIQDYRGDQEMPFTQGLEAGDVFIGNLTFALTNTMISIISGRNPDVILTPKGRTLASDDAWRKARINEVLIQSHHREARFKRDVDRALMSAFLSPMGIVRHGYTPSIEEYTDKGGEVFARFKNERPDFPWIRFYRPWDVRIDSVVNSFDPEGEVRWVAFRDVYHKREIEKNPNLIMRKDLTPTFTQEPYQAASRAPRTEDNPEIAKMYEIWTVYDASTRTFFGISPGCRTKLIREEEKWPIEWGQLPYSILEFNEQMDSPFAIPFPKMYAHEQALYNKVWTIINAIASRARRVVFVNGQAFESKTDQKENLFNMESLAEFIECDGNPNEAVREIALGILDPQLVGLLYQLKESIREVIGIANYDRGQRINVETAAESNAVSAGSAIQKTRNQVKFEAFWENITRVSHRALSQVQDVRKFVVPIVGEENAKFLSEDEVAQGFVEVQAEDLQGEFDYGVKQDSTLPADMASDFAVAAAVYQTLGGPNATLLHQREAQADLVKMAGVDAHRWVMSREQVMAAEQQRAQSDQEPETGGEAQVAQGTLGPIAALQGGGR